MSDERGGSGGILMVGLIVASVVVVLAAVGVVQWIERRSAMERALPLRSGTAKIDGVGAAVEIERDGRGIPHISAASERDAWIALGFTHAQDRLAQMLWLRRLARGRTAEVVGESGLAADRMTRTLGIGHIADARYQEMAPELRAVLYAYAVGVNARIERVRRGEAGLPLDVAAWDAPLEDWEASDSLAVFKLISWMTSGSLDTGLVLSDLITRLGGVGARPFFPVSGSAQGVSLPLDLPPAALAPVDADGSTGTWMEERRSSPQPLSPTPSLDVARLDATAWVIPADAAAGDAPLFGAELTFAATAPALAYEVALRGGALDWIGASVPGVPLLWCGRSAGLAWAFTPARVAASDLYIETLRGDEQERYHDGGRWRPVTERIERIRVRRDGVGGGERIEEMRVRSTRHGPLVNALAPALGDSVSVAWVGARRGPGWSSLLSVARSEDAAAARSALEFHQDPPVVAVLADSGGSRAAQLAGWIPQRVLPTSLVPVPGRMRAFHWDERVAFDSLPGQTIVGPARRPRSWVLAADEPLPDGNGPTRIEWLWRPGIRSGRIASLLDRMVQRGGVSMLDAAEVHGDRLASRSVAVREALETFLARADAEPLAPGAEEIRGLLRGWDGVLDVDSAGALAYEIWMQQIADGLFRDVLGPDLLERYSRLPLADPLAVAADIVVAAAHDGAPGAWSDPDRIDALIRESLDRTWIRLGYRLGPNRGHWSWGRLHALSFAPFDAPDTSPRRDLGPFPAGGGAEAVRRLILGADGDEQVDRISGYTMLADLSVGLDEPDAIWSSLAPGQSEHPGDPSRLGGLAAWRDRRLVPVATGTVLDEDPERRSLVLVPLP